MLASDITLDENDHIYTDTAGNVYTSVSTIIGRYKEPFDRLGVAEKVSKAKGVAIAEVLAEWDFAALHGTAVHKQLEGFFLGIDYGTDLIAPYLGKFSEWKSCNVVFYPEAILCDRDRLIAGTSDLLVEKLDGTWSVIDWKTNKAIYQFSYGGKKMKPPLDHLDDCNGIHYALQLSVYAYLLDRPVGKLSIVHLPKGQETIEVIPCPNLRDEVELIFNDGH